MAVSGNAVDELAIRSLYSRCTYAADDYDADAYADCFTEDATLKVENSRFMNGLVASGGAPFANDKGWVVGRKNIRDFLAFLGQFNINSLHIACNFKLERLDGDEAETTAVNAGIVMANLEVYGPYRDKLRRCADGCWRFSERREIFRFEREQQGFADDQ